MVPKAYHFLWSLLITTLATPATRGDVNYTEHVRRVLKTHCVACHNPNRARADLDLSSYEAIVRGSGLGEVVVPNAPEDSLLYLVVAHEAEPAMPPNGKKIPEEDRQILHKWIASGLPKNANATLDSADRSGSENMTPLASVQTDRQTAASPPDARVFHAARLNPVNALAISPDNTQLAVAGEMQVLLFSLPDRQFSQVLPFPEGEVRLLVFNRSGDRLLAAGGVPAQSGAVVVWNLQDKSRVSALATENDTLVAADFLPNSSRILLGGPTRLLYMADLDTHQAIHRIDKHTDWVMSICSGPDGLFFVSGDRDGGLYAWESESGKLLHSFRGHKDAITGIAIASADRCVSASEDGTIRVWDLHQGQEIGRWTAHPEGVKAIAVTENDHIVSVGRDAKYAVWSLAGDNLAENNRSENLPTSLAASNEHICIGHFDGSSLIWDHDQNTTVDLVIPNESISRQQETLLVATAEPIPLITSPAKESQIASIDASFATAAVDSRGLDTVADPEINSVIEQAASLELRLSKFADELPQMIEQIQTSRRALEEYEAQIAQLKAAMNAERERLESIEAKVSRLTE